MCFMIAGLAVALHQPHPEAGEFAIALRRHDVPVFRNIGLSKAALSVTFGATDRSSISCRAESGSMVTRASWTIEARS
jgi:hypothetical protein